MEIWKVKNIKSPATPINSQPLRLNYVNNAKIRVKFDSSCLKQGKISFTHGNVVNFFIFTNYICGHAI